MELDITVESAGVDTQGVFFEMTYWSLEDRWPIYASIYMHCRHSSIKFDYLPKHATQFVGKIFFHFDRYYRF